MGLKMAIDETKKKYFDQILWQYNNVPSFGYNSGRISDMMLYDAQTGKLLALIDCDWITTMRTGAVAAVSIKALRKSSASIYGFVGLEAM